MKYYTADILMVLFAGAIGWFGHAAYQKSKPKPAIAAVKKESLEEFVERQPRSSLQGNLYCVLAAHRVGRDWELSNAIYSFAISERDRLTGEIKELENQTNVVYWENELEHSNNGEDMMFGQTNRTMPPTLHQPQAVKAQSR